MSLQARATSVGHAQGAVVDVRHGLHVLDPGDHVGDGVGGCVESPRAIDLEEDEVDLLLPGLLDPADQVRLLDRVERPVDLDPDRLQDLAERRVVGRRTGRRAGRRLATSDGVSAISFAKPSSRARLAVRTPSGPPSQAGSSTITWCVLWNSGSCSAMT